MNKSLIKKAKKAAPFTRERMTKGGKLTKKAQNFLQMCKEQFGFEPAKEFIQHYSREMIMYQELWLDYSNKDRRQTMTEVDINAFWKLHAEIKDSLATFMRYSYPTQRATQVKDVGGPTPVFHINLVPQEPAMRHTNSVINVTPED